MVYEFDERDIEFHIWDADADRVDEAFKELAKGMDRQELIWAIRKDNRYDEYSDNQLKEMSDEELRELVEDLDFEVAEKEFDDFMYDFFEEDAIEEYERSLEYDADIEAGLSYYFRNC